MAISRNSMMIKKNKRMKKTGMAKMTIKKSLSSHLANHLNPLSTSARTRAPLQCRTRREMMMKNSVLAENLSIISKYLDRTCIKLMRM